MHVAATEAALAGREQQLEQRERIVERNEDTLKQWERRLADPRAHIGARYEPLLGGGSRDWGEGGSLDHERNPYGEAGGPTELETVPVGGPNTLTVSMPRPAARSRRRIGL
jgi:hypothetical protein